MMALMVAGSLLSGIPSASARDDRVGSAGHSKMPEPLLTESITDLDGLDANEVELDGNAFGGRSAAAATVWQSSLEAEWRALERLGLALEVGLSGATGSPSSSSPPSSDWTTTTQPNRTDQYASGGWRWRRPKRSSVTRK